MLGLDYIKDVVENKLGIKNTEQFDAYQKEKYDNKVIITQEEIEQLSPDLIDSGDFWGYLEEKFSRAVSGAPAQNAEEAIHNNSILHSMTGVIGFIYGGVHWFKQDNQSLLEIGPGHGSLAQAISRLDSLTYEAIDVFPRFEGVKIFDGLNFPEETLGQKRTYVVCINVFQHLSKKQRSFIFGQASEVTAGFFIVGCNMANNNLLQGYDGAKYICHYGQYTPPPTHDEIMQLAEINNFVLSQVMYRTDGYHVYIFRKNHSEN